MCGIVGIVDFRSDVDREIIRKAASTLRLRGPDDSGVWTSGNVGLGHQRLSVIDLSSSGHQPMVSADGRYVIVYNGEIYNFLEIREELSHDGGQWRSATDTEVIIRSYERWGPRCLERFHGMFAFAIWDRHSRAMFSARDRMGVKPYYFHYSSDCFAFASRPRALLSLNRNWSEPLDEQALRFYMESGYIPAPYSAFKQIRKLPPAYWLLIDSTGIRLERYWDFRQIAPETSWENRTEADLLDELDEILTRSVHSRMTSDVPLGAFLSGGIDSSLVVAMMAKQCIKPVKTFTIGFETKAYDESPFAEAVSQRIGSEHFCEVMNIDDLLRLRPTFSLEFDEPFCDTSAFPTMAVSCLARKHVTVSLSGDGGDELFGGYHYYQLARRLDTFYRLPRAIRSVIASAVAVSPKHRMKLLSAAMRQHNSTDAFCFARSIAKDFNPVLDPDVLRGTIGLNELFAEAARPFPSNLKTSEIAMRLDSFYTLPDDYLQKVDVASMAFSLESREPLLDQDVVEWAMKLPFKWKVRAGQNKYLLRRLAYRYFPRELLDRPKKGFEVPIADWIRGPLQEWATSQLSDSQNFVGIPLSQTRLLELLRIHNSGARQAHPILWAALIYLDFVHSLPDPYEEPVPTEQHCEL
jgi:asparagine synthase (glutamine-hydrolysing)